MFLKLGSLKHNNHTIYPDWRLTSDHALLIVNILIFEKYIQIRKRILVKNSEEEEFFIKKLIEAIERLNIENIQSKEVLEQIIQLFTSNTEVI